MTTEIEVTSESDRSCAGSGPAQRSKQRTRSAAGRGGGELSPDAVRMLALIAFLRLQRQKMRLLARLKNRVIRPSSDAARPAAIMQRANRQRRDYRVLAPITPRSPHSVPTSRAPPRRFQPAANIICRPAPAIIENAAAGAEAAPPSPMDDIERAYGDDCAAIMREFANRMAGARSPGERRAIKSARRSTLAAAKEKATRAKAARKAANAAQRQTVQRRPSRPSRPEPRPG